MTTNNGGTMHELPGFREVGGAWDELEAASRHLTRTNRPKGERRAAKARLRRAAIAYADAWRRALDSLRGEFQAGPGEAP